MKIRNRKPWYYYLWLLRFPNAKWEDGTIFVWGNTVYCKNKLVEPIVVHETVHINQMKGSYIRGLVWLFNYALNPQFRMRQEIPAHQAEYKVAGDKYLEPIARRLSGKLYNNLMTFEQACVILKQ